MEEDDTPTRPPPHLRTYLVVVDETPEARLALRFAARRAIRTGGTVELLAIVPPPEFVQWSGVQAAIEEETLARTQGLIAQVAGELLDEAGLVPRITIKHGEPYAAVIDAIGDDGHVDALVLAAAAKGKPGPLVERMTGDGAGALPCPLMIIPGGLEPEAIDRLT